MIKFLFVYIKLCWWGFTLRLIMRYMVLLLKLYWTTFSAFTVTLWLTLRCTVLLLKQYWTALSASTNIWMIKSEITSSEILDTVKHPLLVLLDVPAILFGWCKIVILPFSSNPRLIVPTICCRSWKLLCNLVLFLHNLLWVWHLPTHFLFYLYYMYGFLLDILYSLQGFSYISYNPPTLITFSRSGACWFSLVFLLLGHWNNIYHPFSFFWLCFLHIYWVSFDTLLQKTSCVLHFLSHSLPITWKIETLFFLLNFLYFQLLLSCTTNTKTIFTVLFLILLFPKVKLISKQVTKRFVILMEYSMLHIYQEVTNIKNVKYLLAPIKVRLSPSKKIALFASVKGLLKMMIDFFYFILKTVFVLQIFRFLSWLFGHLEKTSRLETRLISKLYDVTTWLTNNNKTHIPQQLKK